MAIIAYASLNYLDVLMINPQEYKLAIKQAGMSCDIYKRIKNDTEIFNAVDSAEYLPLNGVLKYYWLLGGGNVFGIHF